MKLVGIVEFNNQVIEDDTDQLPTNAGLHACLHPAVAQRRSLKAPGTASSSSTVTVTLRRSNRRFCGSCPGALPLTSVSRHHRGQGRAGGQTGVHRPRGFRAHRPDGGAGHGAAGHGPPATVDRGRPTDNAGAGCRAGHHRGRRLSGMVIAIVAGSLLACAVAVALSPLSPLGPVRRVYHPSVLVFDWTVLGGGLSLLIGGLGISRRHPRRADHAPPAVPASSSRTVLPTPGWSRPSSALGLPLPGGSRSAPRPRAGSRPYRRTRPMGPGWGRHRVDDHHRHVDFQQQSEHFDLPPQALRLELGLRPHV